jgi:hypothetical protein
MDQPSSHRNESPGGRTDAQARIDRITAFGDELQALEQDGVLTLDDVARNRVATYHASLIDQFRTRFDVDIGADHKRLSLGMRIASLIGALALSAALFFFFYRIWGLMATPLQVSMLIIAPVIAVGAAAWAAERERTLYFTSLLALLALTCFVLNLSMLGQIFNITPSQNAFLAWGLFAGLLAYAWGLKLVLTAGLVCLVGYLSASVGAWGGMYWLHFGQRPENVLIAGALISLPGFFVHRMRPEFAGIYRNFGLLVVFISVLILAHWGRASYLQLSPSLIEGIYQTAGFAGSALVIWLGIRQARPGLFNLGSTFFILFLYTKVFDWWWDWLPKWLFFLIVGLIALALLAVMAKLRSTGKAMGP